MRFQLLTKFLSAYGLGIQPGLNESLRIAFIIYESVSLQSFDSVYDLDFGIVPFIKIILNFPLGPVLWR